jgi:hypothetical protein
VVILEEIAEKTAAFVVSENVVVIGSAPIAKVETVVVHETVHPMKIGAEDLNNQSGARMVELNVFHVSKVA